MELDVKRTSDDVEEVNLNVAEQRRHRQNSLLVPSNSSKSEHALSAGAGVLHQHNSQHQQLRKSNKPLMEKRRRERINNCLDQLKSILMEVSKKESTYYAKLEKADILEMTVKYMKNLKRQQHLTAAAPSLINNDLDIDLDEGGSAEADNDSMSKYVAGFNECASEVNHYLSSLDIRRSLPGIIGVTGCPAASMPLNGSFNSSASGTSTATVDSEVRDSLLEHLADSLTRSTASRQSTSSPDTTTKTVTPIVDNMRQSHSEISDETQVRSAVSSTFPLLPSRSRSEDVQPPEIGEHHLLDCTTSLSRPFSAPYIAADSGNNRLRLELSNSAASTRLWSQPQPEIAMTMTSSGRSLPSLQVLPARLATGEIVFLLAGGCATSGKIGRYSPMTGGGHMLSPNRISESGTSSMTVHSPFLNVGASDGTHLSASTLVLTRPLTGDATSPSATTRTPLDLSFLSKATAEQLQPFADPKQEVSMDIGDHEDDARKDSVVNYNEALADLGNNNIELMWRPW